jgi:hypothetical protein
VPYPHSIRPGKTHLLAALPMNSLLLTVSLCFRTALCITARGFNNGGDPSKDSVDYIDGFLDQMKRVSKSRKCANSRAIPDA